MKNGLSQFWTSERTMRARNGRFPGSVHVNAYDDLRKGRPGALAQMVIPADRPVVTVCNVGRMSQTAADVLTGLGWEA